MITLLTSPLLIVFSLFSLQYLIWFLFMPQNPTLFGLSPRYEEAWPQIAFVFFVSIFLASIRIGQSLTQQDLKNKAIGEQTDLAYLWPIVYSSLVLTAVGELIYVRSLLLNPLIIWEAIQGASVSNIGEAVREVRVTGLSTFNNLFVVPVAALSMLAFHKDTTDDTQRSGKRWLIVLGVLVAGHALLLSARMFMVYYAAIVLAGYLYTRPEAFTLKRWVSPLLAGLMGGFIFLGELSRSGLYLAARTGDSVFSYEILSGTLERLVLAYAASDLNNAFIILDDAPTYQWISLTMLSVVANSLGYTMQGYADLQNWTSLFGTVNCIGLWWFDMGYATLLMCLLLGLWLGMSSERLKSQRWLGINELLFLVGYPGMFAITRVNHYGASIFVLPLAFLLLWALFRGSPREAKPFRSPSGAPP